MTSTSMVAEGEAQSVTQHSRAWWTFEKNLDTVLHFIELQRRDQEGVVAQLRQISAEVSTYVKDEAGPTRLAGEVDALATRMLSVSTFNPWRLVMLVTFIEAYLQDVLVEAAAIDGEFMTKSEQPALYADVVAASSIDELANDMRVRWARRWVDDGGPLKWTKKLTKMGGGEFDARIVAKLEEVWGIRHVVIHRAGVVDKEFAMRHTSLGKKAGDALTVGNSYFKEVFDAVGAFIDPTEAYFLARVKGLGVPKS